MTFPEEPKPKRGRKASKSEKESKMTQPMKKSKEKTKKSSKTKKVVMTKKAPGNMISKQSSTCVDDRKTHLLQQQATLRRSKHDRQPKFVKTVTFSLQLFLSDKTWKKNLQSEFQKEYFQILEELLGNDYERGKEIFPPKDLIFNSFKLTPFEKVRTCVILRNTLDV